MQKNYALWAVIAVIIIGGAIFLIKESATENALQNQGDTVPTTETNTSGTIEASVSAPAKSKDTGRVIFSITDEAVGLDTLQSIMLTVNELSVQSSQGSWVSISKTPRTFDLLNLHEKARNELLSDLNLTAGSYTKIRLSIGKVVIVSKEGLKNVEAKLPSQTLTFNTKIVVEKGGTSGVSFDFDSGKALHRTGDGTILFFPVVKLNTQHGIGLVQMLGGNVELLNGLSDFDQTLGVDENGNLKIGFALAASTKLELLGNIVRILPADEKAADLKVSAQTAIDTAIQSGYISTALSVQTILREKSRVWQIVGTKGAMLVTVYVDINTGKVVSVQ
ncbi:MAG: hypothetical protein A3C06_00980 [Candidatus Taylorbacteria bacterium RIFCSPHIGHO2_02_FULL_46_13]|uniref:DUF4382 domain-containing protein n=1 Tax=Candidatus Taylorbacteria bacterium RIFCSPHIGHO2_02_FULL_46_13 TaxID=1802312 RepID=A0A1G2MT30_9BACT|nr:MAG: hypothetical protein A3C06_00980 [Candidatus Taylorbacteria bacterium RIFCSPHIGHO2_02_FULL_46_13]